MTDPFADLERELLAAHARRPRRSFRAVPGVVATLVLLVAFVALAGRLAAPGDPERAAAPQQKPSIAKHDQPGITPGRDCPGGPWAPPQAEEPIPAAITERMAIFRAPPGEGEPAPDPHMTGRQSTRLYANGRRTLPAVAKFGVHVIAAEIVPRDQVGGLGEPCAEPRGAVEPGVCLVLTHGFTDAAEGAKGALASCFTMAEILGGEAFIDADGRIIGFAPDGVRTASAHGASSRVRDNAFTLPGGPETTVVFAPEVTG